MNPTNFGGPHNSNHAINQSGVEYGPFTELLPQDAFSMVKVSAPNQKSGS